MTRALTRYKPSASPRHHISWKLVAVKQQYIIYIRDHFNLRFRGWFVLLSFGLHWTVVHVCVLFKFIVVVLLSCCCCIVFVMLISALTSCVLRLLSTKPNPHPDRRHGVTRRWPLYYRMIVNLSSCIMIQISNIEKVPRGIQGEKSSKDTASSRNLVSTIGAQASPKKADGTRCPEG